MDVVMLFQDLGPSIVEAKSFENIPRACSELPMFFYNYDFGIGR